MFLFKNKLVTVDKITFSNIDRFLFFITLLIPEIKEKQIIFKQKNKRLFKIAIQELIRIICYPNNIKPFFLKEHIYILSNIVQFTKLYDILDKINKSASGEKEKEIITEKGEVIYKSDYIKTYLDTYYKHFLRYIDCFETDFRNKVGFLEYEELIATLEKRRLERQLETIYSVGCGFGGGEESVKNIEKAIKEIEEIGFDKKRFTDDLLGVWYGW